MDLFQTSQKPKSFEILESCFANGKQDEARTGTSFSPFFDLSLPLNMRQFGYYPIFIRKKS